MWTLFAMLAAAAAGPGAPDRAELQSMFQMMDRNGDGYITANEAPRITRVRAASAQTGATSPAASWIERYDADGDGRISEDEYVIGAEADASS